MSFCIVHEIPGRIRLRADKHFSYELAVSLAERLDAVPGIEGVRVSPRTGSVLLLYATGEARDEACRLLLEMEELPVVEILPAVAAPDVDHPSLAPFFRYFCVRPFLPMPLRILTAVRSGIPFIRKGFSMLFRGRVNVDVLDATAIGVSLAMRDYNTVGLLTLLLGFGEALELWTRKKSLTSLAERLALNVDTVWVRRGELEIAVPIVELQADDLVVVRTGAAIPVDGTVVSGEASVNQASMTGEPLGVLRSEGASVFAGTVVEEGEIVIRPTGVGDGTRLNKIIKFIEESELRKADIQGRAERLADAVVPFSFLLAGAVWMVTRNPMRAAGVLMVDYSCALKLATPLAILAAIKEGAGCGVLVKGGRFLETLSAVNAVVFDKTGTLTESRPRVVEVVPAEGWGRDEVLRLAACLEEHFPHPVARAVVRKAEEEALQHQEEHAEVRYIVAHGIASELHGKRVFIGSRHYIEQDEGISVAPLLSEVERLAREGHSVLYLAQEDRLVGLIGIEDPLREESADVIRQLRERGIKRIVMLTGDDERTAAAVAARLGITEYRAQILPTDKAAIIEELKAEGHTVLMTGDGINDSPALSAADVGVTLRDGADLAREVADVVLTNCNLRELSTAMELGDRTLRRIRTNFGLTMSLNSLFLAGSLFGVLQPGGSAVLHNLTTLGVCLNAMRPMLPRGENAA